MKKVKIGELKNRLSAYLGLVRKGEEILVTDREHPIAKVIPIREGERRLKIIKALYSPSTLKELPYPRPKKSIDALAALAEEREDS